MPDHTDEHPFMQLITATHAIEVATLQDHMRANIAHLLELYGHMPQLSPKLAMLRERVERLSSSSQGIVHAIYCFHVYLCFYAESHRDPLYPRSDAGIKFIKWVDQALQ